jgi:uncharacterized protein YbjT (DUF2867 family)
MMQIVVIGGSGLIGSHLVRRLRGLGHEVVAASPAAGGDALTGAGVAEALQGAQVVVDVTHSPAFADAAVRHFFHTSARTLLPAEVVAGVRHHVALSVVGADRMPDSGYMRAKVAQEATIQAATVPSPILRATQCCEFLGSMADGSPVGGTVRVSPALLPPVAAADVASALADIAGGAPLNGMVEVAGPEPRRLDDLARRVLAAQQDVRQVTADVHARDVGAALNEHTLTPGEHPRVAPTRSADGLSRAIPHREGRPAGSTPSSRTAPNRRCAARHSAARC